MLILTQLKCVVHHDISHTLHIAEYNQTKITLSCDQSDHSQFIIQISYSHFKINPQDLSCSQYQHEACYPTIEQSIIFSNNNGNENLKIHINFTYSKQFNKVQVTFDIKETYLSKHT